jgi:hypothetical protein
MGSSLFGMDPWKHDILMQHRANMISQRNAIHGSMVAQGKLAQVPPLKMATQGI